MNQLIGKVAIITGAGEGNPENFRGHLSHWR
jgi:hypothetical protein